MGRSSSPWSLFSADPRKAAHQHLRAADSDRDLVIRLLSDAYVEGKLGAEELGRRSESALTAGTLGECLPLVQDLAAGQQRRVARTDVHGSAMTYTRAAVGAGLAPLLVYAVVRAFGGMGGGWQPPAVFWILAVILAAHAAAVVGGRAIVSRVDRRMLS